MAGYSAFAGMTATVFSRTWRQVFRRPVVLVFSLVQPLMWMSFFGFLFHRYSLEKLPNGYAYLDFLMPGICVMTVLFGASQSGTSLIKDMQTGFLDRLLGTPAPPAALLAGKLLADASRLLGQALIVGLLGVALGSRIHLQPVSLAGAAIHLFLFALAYAGLSCFLALTTRSQELMGVFIQAVNMPLLFTSTVLVPSRQMPDWLSALAGWNPLSPVADGLRHALLPGMTGRPIGSAIGMGALAIALFAAACAALRRYRTR